MIFSAAANWMAGIATTQEAEAGSRALLYIPDGTGNQPIGWHPCRVPAFHGHAAHGAFKAADLAAGGHGLGAVVNRSALAGSAVGF
jgi:hypothetical protein